MKKARQESEFDCTTITRVPFLKQNSKRILEGGSSQESIINKRPRVLDIPPEVIVRTFEDSMRKHLISKIKPIINKGGTKMVKSLNDLKSTSLKATTLPRGILTSAAETSGCTPSVFNQRLNEDSPKRNFVAWHDLVGSNFDDIVQTLKTTTKEPREHQATTATFEEYKTFSTSLNQLIRKGLPPEVRSIIHTKISNSLKNVSEFIIDFSRVIWMMMITLTHSQFKLENDNSLALEPLEEGFQISSILPEGFQLKQCLLYSSSSLPFNDLLKKEFFSKDFELLFGDGHLSLIRSYYFGSRGAQESTLNKHPVFNALFNALESSGITKGMYSRGDILSPTEMEVALKTYKTNFSNMWKAGTISNKLLNHLLDVLLRVYLAPKREAKRTEYIEEISQ
jgi:hypothetical protein